MKFNLRAAFCFLAIAFLTIASGLTTPAPARMLHGIGGTYTGLVASRARMTLNTFGTGSSQSMSRSGHIAATNITALKLVYGNFAGGNPDTSLGASQSITASIEYPAGTFTQVKFSGVATGTNPDFGVLTSDLTTVSIPNAATFWIRTWTSGAIYFNSWNNSFFGEYWAAGATVADQTMSGTLTGSAVNSGPPLMIAGPTTQASAIIVGDSVGYGLGDTEDSSATATGFDGKVGIVARNLGNTPFCNLSITGMLAQTWIANSTGKKKAIGLSSHIITELGRNDLSNSETTAQITGFLQTIWALATAVNPNTKIYQTTITPLTTDPGTPSAAWTTLGQQTLAASATERAAFNASVLSTLSGATGSYDVASPLVDTGSQKWIVTPTPPYTGDGTHPTTSGYALVQAANKIPTLVYP